MEKIETFYKEYEDMFEEFLDNVKRNIRLPRTFGEEYTRDSILFRIKHTKSFKVPFPEAHTLTGRFHRKNKTSIRNKTKAKGLRALYLYYCYLLKIFPEKKSKGKVSQYMREEIKKLDQFSNATRFLVKYKITTLTEIKEDRTNAVTDLNELKGKRENLWRKHNRVKTDEEGQYICSEIQKLATKIDELNKNIKLCNFIEERTLRMKDNVKEMSQEIKFKIKNRDRDYTIITNKALLKCGALFVSFHIFFSFKERFLFRFFRHLYKIRKRHCSFSMLNRINLGQKVNHIAEITMGVIERSILFSLFFCHTIPFFSNFICFNTEFLCLVFKLFIR